VHRSPLVARSAGPVRSKTNYVSTKKVLTMKSSLLLFALIALGVGWTIHALYPSVRQEAPDARAVSLPAPTGSGGRDEPTTDDLVVLKHDMALVKSDLGSLRASLTSLATQVQSASLSRGEPAEHIPHEEPQAIDSQAQDAAAMEEDAMLQETRLEAIEATLRGEAIDATWAAQATDAIEQALEDKALEGSVLDALECRSTLCRVEVTHPNPIARADFMLRFPMKVGQVLPSMTVRPIEGDDGSSTSSIYLAREGHELPPLEP